MDQVDAAGREELGQARIHRGDVPFGRELLRPVDVDVDRRDQLGAVGQRRDRLRVGVGDAAGADDRNPVLAVRHGDPSDRKALSNPEPGCTDALPEG